MSSYNTYTQEAGELTEKNHPRQKQQKKKKKKERKKEKEKRTYPQATRQRKLEIALNLLFFKDVTITDNLQNLRFNQHSPKNMNQNMFCTESKLL